MAHGIIILGRFTFIALLMIQCFFLASYPAKYENKDAWYGLTPLFAPAIVMWLFVIRKEENLRFLFLVWTFYIFAFVVNVGIIFGLVEQKLDSGRFFGPNILKMTFCISPLLLLLLLNTATGLSEYRALVAKLSFRVTLDLFDGIEMLEVVLEENENSHGIPGSFEVAIIVFACLSFLFSPLQMVENKVENGGSKIRKRIATFRIIAQVLVVNFVFLVLRLILSLDYGKDASIFIAKNVITIINCLLEICSIRGWCGFEDW